MPGFTVDTRLFRELGELLVGRDSTALAELIKNAYDADATTVSVYGEALDDPDRGSIKIVDDGLGMTLQQFTDGFLRIASRSRTAEQRVSRRFGRQYTGAKGIGRLAAHKLARLVVVDTVPHAAGGRNGRSALHAEVDWDLVERYETIDQVDEPAVMVRKMPADPHGKSGTTITLRRLRRRWTREELGRLVLEVQNFEPPATLCAPLPERVTPMRGLFDSPIVREGSGRDPGFTIQLEGAFEAGESYWEALAEEAMWVIEIDGPRGRNKVTYRIWPTARKVKSHPEAEQREFTISHPDPENGPFFQCRVLVREGQMKRSVRQWANQAAGVRVYLEGFRILPYGELGNDWLSIDADYARRSRTLPWLEEPGLPEFPRDLDAALGFLQNLNYFGAVFLTESNASPLRILVNREGFVPETGYDTLRRLIRIGVDLSVRVRASTSLVDRQVRREKRSRKAAAQVPAAQSVQAGIARTRSLLQDATRQVAERNLPGAKRTLSTLENEVEELALSSQEIISAESMLRVLASVGAQMSVFVHEINVLLGMAQPLERSIARLRDTPSLPSSVRADVSRLHGAMGDLRRTLERQASYLVDVVTPDARRRRARQSLAERFEAGLRLVSAQIERRGIEVRNEIPPDLRSPPMFAAELITVFSNLLTNAVKAAGNRGGIRASGERLNGKVRILLENTGVAVSPDDGERWFRPFESTTAIVDPVLGQGMGMGLPITRSTLEEYGAEIRFSQPSKSYQAAVEILFPQ